MLCERKHREIITEDIYIYIQTCYTARNTVEETGYKISNGLREIYVNTTYNDGSLIAELMQCFLQTEIDNPNFPILADELRAEKGNMRGDESMCEIVEAYAKKRGQEERAEGEVQGALNTLVALVQKHLLSPADAAKEVNMSEQEFMKLVQV